MTDRELYELLKRSYEVLEVDENADEKKIKSKYRFLFKKYHPDHNPGNKEAEEKAKALSEAYNYLKDEKNRRIYCKLKEKYEEKTTKREEKRTEKYSTSPKRERSDKYIFKRKDGSMVEILPVNRHILNEQTIYCYKIMQYYKNITIINNVYGRINLAELFRTPEYCEFCVNNFLSRENIENSILHYDGYLGYIEAAIKNGRKLYRVSDINKQENFDMAIDVGKVLSNNNNESIFETEGNDFFLEKKGMMMINGKIVNQYLLLDGGHIMELIYSEEIDFDKAKKDKKYKRAIIKKLLDDDRVKRKISEGGYIGNLRYNIETDDYDVVVDNELSKFFNVRKTDER